MVDFTYHTPETAPEDSKPLFEKSMKNFGMIPNLHAVMAESPSLLHAYQVAHEYFQKTSLNVEEQTVVWQAINVEHDCGYCVPAHTAIALMSGVNEDISNALRDETPLPEKLEALRNFTLQMVRERGQVSEEQMNTFFAAGYSQEQVLDIILCIAQKVMSNYTNHVAQTEVDGPFQKFAWSKTA